ncbi:glutaredoxin [Trinickia symbiotica]|uniref:Glutaredoxin n=1 Tax=Trinickia symbiotica TaxID=863227 RepID=A0A2T3XPG8_9BURK|nr:glutaredoxin family protein [Trinickia symbiotica]PTB18414.1 glutaredoxin [Trinickia symbiotica]
MTQNSRVPTPSAPTLALYSRAWCHLCEEMRAALVPLAAEFGAKVEVIDVDADPALVARYDELVPVLVLDGVELSRYRLDAERVRATLAARRMGV